MGPRTWWKRRVHKDHKPPNPSSRENPNPPLTNPESNSKPAPPPQSLTAARDALWRKAYEALRAEQPDAIANYEAIVKDDANLPQDANLFDYATFAAVVRTQKQKMENKQWTYPWFDRPRKIRDTIEAILTIISESSPIISTSMNFTPIFVSLPWSFISLLIPFVMRDFTEMQNAIDGLKAITCILSSYSLAEEEFLSLETTRMDFEATVLGMYTKMLEFQATAAQYFAAGTLRRLGRNVRPGTPWKDALAAVEQAEKLCHVPINALAVRLQRRGFESLQTLLMERTASLNKAIDEASARRNKSRQVTEWISLIDPFQDHGELRRRLGDEYLGTGQWALEDSRFSSWSQNASGLLLLQGVIGTGKSSIICVIVNHLMMASSDGRLAFFYCSANASYIDPQRTIRNDTTNIFRSILAQCSILPDGSIAEQVLDAYNRTKYQGAGESGLTLGETIQLLLDVLSARDDQITLVFDALDELADQQSFMETLSAIYESKVKVRVLLSSRFGVDVSTRFPDVVSLQIQSQNSKDIRHYVAKEISRRSAGCGLDEAQAKRLERALTTWSEGVFRWVVLELDIFLPRSRRQGNVLRADFERRLVKLENSRAPAVDRLFLAYEQVYQDAMGEEDEENRRDMVNAVLKLVLCSIRPLTAAELTTLASLSQVKHYYKSLVSGPEEPRELKTQVQLVSEAQVLSICANFIVKSANGLIRLAHLSVRQFFEERRTGEFKSDCQHHEAAIICIAIRYPPLNTIVAVSEELTQYAARFWAIHCRNASQSPQLAEFKSLAESDDSGLDESLQLVSSNANLAEQDHAGNTVLHRAVLREKAQEIQLLLDVDVLFQRPSALVGVRNNDGELPIHIAATHGFRTAFKLLVSAGSAISAQNNMGLTPLHIAVLGNHEELIQAAIESGVSLSSLDKTSGTALHTAAFRDSPIICRRLLAAGIDATVENQDGDTALDIAVHQNNKLAEDALSAEEGRETQVPVLDADDLPRRRPKIHVDTNSDLCEYCDVEEWLEGSLESLSYPHWASLEDLEASAIKGCALCGHFYQAIHPIRNELRSAPDKQFELRVGVKLAIDTQGRADQDMLFLTLEGRILAQFEFYLDPNKEEISSIFTGRTVSGDAVGSMSTLMEWLHTCCKEHQACNFAPSSQQPARLLEIHERQGNISLRLVPMRDSPMNSVKFVFASFVWGTHIALIPMTMMENIDEWSQSIPFERFPRLLQDIILTTYRLGYRYLFLDCICIIQDSTEDKRTELNRLSQYASLADLVIAATGAGVEGELFGSLHTSRPLLTVNISLQHQDPVNLYLRHCIEGAKEVLFREILARSWRSQDVILSRRILMFGRDQMFWHCACSLRSQGNTIGQPPLFRNVAFLKYQAHVVASQQDMQCAAKLIRAHAYYQWYEYVQMSTAGAVAFRADRLAVCLGVARAVDGIIAQYSGLHTARTFSAGLWVDDFLRGLLWAVKSKSGMRFEKDTDIAPTWSWASSDAAISYHIHPADHLDSSSNLEIIHVDGREISHIFGRRHTWDPLIVRGKSCQFKKSSLLSGYTLLFDTVKAQDDYELDQSFILLRVSASAYTATGRDLRWVGLILQHRVGTSEAERAGLFIGPDCSVDTLTWAKDTFNIV